MNIKSIFWPRTTPTGAELKKTMNIDLRILYQQDGLES